MNSGSLLTAQYASIGAALFALCILSVSAEERPIDPVLPIPIEPNLWTPLRELSPFTRSLFLSESLILTGMAEVNGNPTATLIDTESAESIAVSTYPSERGWRLVEVSGGDDIETAVAIVLVESGEAIRVRYDEARLKNASQRIKFAAQARSQRISSQIQRANNNSGTGQIPRERAELFHRIDRVELPKAYNPGSGKNREESHRLHQEYVDRRMAGLSQRQRGLVGSLWQQKQSIDPGMNKRGASFVRILEYVAENESR